MVRGQSGPFSAQPVAWPRLYGAIAVAPLADERHALNRRHAACGKALAAKRPDGEATFVWAEHPHRRRVGGWEPPRAVGMTGAREGRARGRGGGGDWGGPQSAWW